MEFCGCDFIGRILYARVSALIPEHRKKMQEAQRNPKGTQKDGAKSGGGASKQPTGKGAPAQTKKKKKGKR